YGGPIRKKTARSSAGAQAAQAGLPGGDPCGELVLPDGIHWGSRDAGGVGGRQHAADGRTVPGASRGRNARREDQGATRRSVHLAGGSLAPGRGAADGLRRGTVDGGAIKGGAE